MMGYSGVYNTVSFVMPEDIESMARNASACVIFYAHSSGAHFTAFKWEDSQYTVYNDSITKFSSVEDYMSKVNGTFIMI